MTRDNEWTINLLIILGIIPHLSLQNLSFYRDNLPVSETKGVKVSLEMKDYLADFIVGVYKEAKLQRLYPWQVSMHICTWFGKTSKSMVMRLRS